MAHYSRPKLYDFVNVAVIQAIYGISISMVNSLIVRQTLPVYIVAKYRVLYLHVLEGMILVSRSCLAKN